MSDDEIARLRAGLAQARAQLDEERQERISLRNEVLRLRAAITEAEKARDAAASDLLAALLTSPCPHPERAGFFAVMDCIYAGNCACDNGAAIAKATGKGSESMSGEVLKIIIAEFERQASEHKCDAPYFGLTDRGVAIIDGYIDLDALAAAIAKATGQGSAA